MTEQEKIINTIKVLRNEVEVLTRRTRDRSTGHLHTAIGVINGRIDELIGKAIDGQPDQGRALSSKIFDKDVYDGYKDHTEAMEQARLRTLGSSAYQRAGAMEQARLRKIQDAAAGRSTDDYEHTKEYYDKERNRAMEGENLPITDPFTEGLSNRSMKQKHGRAVQTVSEMMQEELEPLPINTFE